MKLSQTHMFTKNNHCAHLGRQISQQSCSCLENFYIILISRIKENGADSFVPVLFYKTFTAKLLLKMVMQKEFLRFGQLESFTESYVRKSVLVTTRVSRNTKS